MDLFHLDSPLPHTDNAGMNQDIVIERISFNGTVGVSQEERALPQPLLVDLEVTGSIHDAITTDELTKTIDYAVIVSRVVDVGSSQSCALLETLADRICQVLLAEFPIDCLHIWLRKTAAPLPYPAQSVGIRSTYNRRPLSHPGPYPASSVPARFLVDQHHNLPHGNILDVASGSGRHALWLASQGHQVHAIDRNQEVLESAMALAQARQISTLTTQVIDLEANPHEGPSLGNNAYDGIIVFYYLFRPLFPSLIQALKPGGILIYESFLIDNHHHYQHPRRTEFCLQHNELLSLAHGLRVLHYHEGIQEHDSADGQAPYTAQLVAQKPLG